MIIEHLNARISDLFVQLEEASKAISSVRATSYFRKLYERIMSGIDHEVLMEHCVAMRREIHNRLIAAMQERLDFLRLPSAEQDEPTTVPFEQPEQAA